MPNMAGYRRQHAEIGEVLGAISGKLDPARLSDGEALAICADIGKLVGMLSVHLESEDESLYPELRASSSVAASQAAERFQSEMDGLKAEVEMFFLKWGSPDAVSGDPGGFVDESRSFCESLTERIEREDAELYALAEQL